MKVALHIGAHKTASTYIQKTLEDNIALLSRTDITYIPLNEMRNSITSKITGNKNDIEELQKLLLKKSDATRLILSDENLIGVPGDLVREGTLYSQAKQRLGKLCNLLGEAEIHIFFAIRSYETFITSVYIELLRHRRFISFDEFQEHFNISDFSWHSVVKALCEQFRQERMTLWDYAEFRNIEDDVFNGLIGLELPIVKLTHPVRQSLSGKAMAALGALRAVLSDDEIRRLVHPVSQAFPKGAENPAFMPFAEDAAMKLRQQFAADMARIRTDFPRINWLGRQHV